MKQSVFLVLFGMTLQLSGVQAADYRQRVELDSYGDLYSTQLNMINNQSSLHDSQCNLIEHGSIFPDSEAAFDELMVRRYVSDPFDAEFEAPESCPAYSDQTSVNTKIVKHLFFEKNKPLENQNRLFESCLNVIFNYYEYYSNTKTCHQRMTTAYTCWKHN